MRKRILNFVASTIIAALVTPALYAQMGAKLAADIPFDFVVGTKTLPAGQYVLGMGTGATPHAIKITSLDGRTSALALTTPVHLGNPANRGVLLFHQYGHNYILSQISSSYSSEAARLPQAKLERELMKSAEKANNVVVAMNR